MKKNLLFLTIITFSTSLFSQNITGLGNVSSFSGMLIPNAIVRISPGSDTNVVYEYVCDKNGNYTFNFAMSDSVYIFKVLPSIQTLQFTSTTENITLSNSDNGILFHKVVLTGNNGIRFTVVDTAGNPVSGTKVLLYDTKRKWRIDSCRLASPVYTDINGQVEINSLLPIEYWFNIKKTDSTNRFTVKNTDTIIDTTLITNITVPIRDLTQNEFYLCGLCDNKTWVTDSMVIYGISQPYNADSKLLSDGTWYDSNGNHGFWWFNEDETKLTYDYDSSSTNAGGSIVEATLIYLTDTSFAGDMTMLGLPVTYYMSAKYDTIALTLSAQDTIIYLDSNGQANITPDDLVINSDYCFTCDTTLSQSVFDNYDVGNVEVYVTLEDRCGNQAIDTITVTVMQANGVNVFLKSNINVYPNPANNFVVIESENERIESIAILDITGKFVKQQAINKEQCIINTKDLAQGIYFIKIITAEGIVTEKLLIK